MARYWIGDLHLGHSKVAKIRYPEAPDDDRVITHHDMVIYDQLKRLTSDDQVWIMGDISSGKPEEEDRALKLLSEIPAQLHLIAGNHDSVSSVNRNGYKHQERWSTVFSSIQNFTRVRLYGKNVLMSHYPYARSGDGPGRGEARHLEFRLPDTGLGLIHAHTHHTEPHMQVSEEYYGNSRVMYNTYEDTQQYCVSWDTKRGLTTEQELTEWAKGLKK